MKSENHPAELFWMYKLLFKYIKATWKRPTKINWFKSQVNKQSLSSYCDFPYFQPPAGALNNPQNDLTLNKLATGKKTSTNIAFYPL